MKIEDVFVVIFLILLVLKLFNIINLSWNIILLPLLLPMICTILLFITFVLMFIILFIACLVDKKNIEWLDVYIKDLRDTLSSNERFNK